MIKSGQIEELPREGFHYITAITKPQIEALAASGVIQMEMFEELLCEARDGGVRYILRRNPRRAEEMATSRADKERCVERLVEKQNPYLRQHPRAAVFTAETRVREKIERLDIRKWLEAQPQDRTVHLRFDDETPETRPVRRSHITFRLR